MAKIVWSDAGLDTITVVSFLETDTISEANFNAATQSTLSVDFDQSLFDTISIGGANGHVDEIRIATTFADAFTATVVPEPSSFALVGLGALALLARRRRQS